MRLTAKLTTVLILCVLVLIVAAEYLTMKHEDEQMNRDMRGDAAHLGRTISHIVDEIWQSSGHVRVKAILREIDQVAEERSVRLVYFDVDRNNLDYPTVPRIMTFHQQVASFPYRNDDGEDHLFTYARLTLDNRPAAIELSEAVEHSRENSNYFIVHAAVLMISTALLGGVLVVALGGAWVGRPLRQLIEKTRRIGQGDLSGPLNLVRRDEFAELAVALNSMCVQLEEAQDKVHTEAAARGAVLEQLRHADRLRIVGRLAAGMAHEVGTPLSVVGGRAGLIASGKLSAEQVHESALTIKSESDRIATIIRQLLDFARRSTPQRKEIELGPLTHQTLELLTPIAEKNNCTLQVVHEPPSSRLRVDAGQLQQVLTNLIMNAIGAMPSGGAVEIGIHQQQATPPDDLECQPGAFFRIDVRDHGDGISEEHLQHLFEPFFTTKDVGKGTGLGLSIVYGIVQEHGGWIDVATEPGKGSCFSVFLPTEVPECKDES